MHTHQTRRSLLKAASFAATAAAFAGKAAVAEPTGSSAKPEPFRYVSAAEIAEGVHTTQEKPGNDNLIPAGALPFSITLTTEARKIASEFEYHEGRDHIFQILDGTTLYDLGGVPQNGRNVRPGEWLAPSSEGFTTLKLNKGDLLTIPRGTPHRRRTEGSVTLMLTSIEGNK